MNPEALSKALKLYHSHGLFRKENGCLEYQGARNEHGYGRIWVRHEDKTHTFYTHRIAFTLVHGEIPDDKVLCHHCDNPACCNPNHIFLGTKTDNWNDMRQKKRNQRGSKHAQAKLNEEKVKEIRKLLADGETIASVARRFGVTRGPIKNIKVGKGWKHVS